jgi:hypothetical protein
MTLREVLFRLLIVGLLVLLRLAGAPWGEIVVWAAVIFGIDVARRGENA